MYNDPSNEGYTDIETGTHLLWDAVSVADTFRLRHVAHQPALDPAEPVIKPEHPADEDNITVSTVTYDVDSGLWRMWYTASDSEAGRAAQVLGARRYEMPDAPKPRRACYAESDDGISWNRVAVNRFDHPCGDNPIVFEGFHGCGAGCVFEVPGAPANRRYAMTCKEWIKPGNGGIMFARSPDGIQWDYPPDVRPVIFGHSDCPNNTLYNPERGVFMIYLRAWHSAAVGWKENGKGNARRRISYSESSDLERWSEPQVILSPDELDTNDYYGLTADRVRPNRYFGQLMVYDEERTGEIWCEPAFSRDGLHWWRLPERSEFIPRLDLGFGMPRMVFPSHRIVEAGDSIYVYYTLDYSQHHSPPRRKHVFRGRLRRDGFVSLRADSPMGNLITRPFTLESDKIAINARCFGGRIEAELVEPDPYDPNGKKVEGVAASDFDTFTGDELHHTLSWNGNSDLGHLRGRRLMLRMALVHADLFSFTI